MKKTFGLKLISVLLVIATLIASVPISAFAGSEALQSGSETEIYMKSVKMAQAKSKEEAKSFLEGAGYIFIDRNLNEGTGADGIWMGYTTTTDPTEAIYDIKLMNTDGGYDLTSMESVLNSQKSSFLQMATDLNYLVEEFVEAYNDGSLPAKQAYMALNFFRIVEGEKTLDEKNGLGYQLVSGNVSMEKLTNIILFCDATILDSIVKILTMGIQVRNANWMESLSKKGAYDSDISYGDDDAELKRRAKQLLVILQLYAQTYNSMDKMGLVSGKFDEQGNIETGITAAPDTTSVTAQEADLIKNDLNRIKSYKLIFDELATYKYGNGTLKDFFCSLETEKNEKVLYPLVSVLSDGEFAALSYGCFIEIALGADASASDFENYDEAYNELTKDVKSVYLYEGVNSVLLNDDTLVAFTDTATQHMALTGEYQFYERESVGEDAWETGRYAALGIGAAGMAVMTAAKVTLGIMSFLGVLTAATAEGATGILAGLAKVCAIAGSGYVTLITMAVAAIVALVTLIIYLVDEDENNKVDWEANPIPEYMYDVREVGFAGASKNDGIQTAYIKRPMFVFYEAVRDINDKVVDLNVRNGEARQWIAMYVSYDRPGDDSKPIKAEDFLVKTGNGETPEGYVPASRFGEVRAYDLNQWDNKDDVNGIYIFYKQDNQVTVDSDTTYYVYDVQLQSGESSAHCISLLEAAGYIPINVNLSPSYSVLGIPATTYIHTYLGYKITDNPNNAITDIRIDYGVPQSTVQLGGVTYAACGTSAGVTLYATKYKAAGTPILAAGLKIVNSREDAGEGYEPACFLSGGPAESFNNSDGAIYPITKDYFLYFLPETTFTSGTAYLGGAIYYYLNEIEFTNTYLRDEEKDGAAILSFLKEKTGKDYPISTSDESLRAISDYSVARLGYPVSTNSSLTYSDAVLYYTTYNPYRAIYGVRGTALEGMPKTITFESQGYVAWSTASWEMHALLNMISYKLCYDNIDADKPVDMSGTLYFAGNPSTTNVYNADTNAMTEIQPLSADDLIFLEKSGDTGGVTGKNSSYVPVSDSFTSSKDPMVVQNEKGKDTKEYVFYVVGSQIDRPYVSSITAVDRLTVIRASGGVAAGVSYKDVTNNMLVAQLAKQGATNFADITASTYREIYWLNAWNPFADEYAEMNVTKFGYTRTDDASLALRDVFIYIAGFSNDDPPRTIQRGTIKYTLLCQLSGNLTGYDEAPAPGIYLYGTTDKKAGDRIIDVEFSDSPFKDGYETVRTQSGRSMWAETSDYMVKQKNDHFMSGAKALYRTLAHFFGFAGEADDNQYYDNLRAKKYYYIHIKREGDDLRTREPYIGGLYLSTGADSSKDGGEKLISKGILDDLFDQGADEYLNFDLNSGVSSTQYIYLGYSYTADPNDAITAIRPSHDSYRGDEVTLRTNGVTYYAVSSTSLNVGAGGEKIYMYYTKSHHEEAGKPITEIRYCQGAAPSYTTTEDAEIMPVMRFDSWKPSDLNAGIRNKEIYLTVVRPFETPNGTAKPINYGADKTYTRLSVTGSSGGTYIAALYVMDKNTIRQEKLASGVDPSQCTCDKISDQEVIDRLKQMGATTVLARPINITGDDYGKDNPNKVFVGYSRTDDYSKAIKDIALKTEVLSLDQPDATISIDKIQYTLVAEAATRVTKLPDAINLIGVEDGQDLLAPRIYLYTTTLGEGEPIQDISIDSDPLKQDWITAVSENRVEAYTDIYNQATKQAKLGSQEDSDKRDEEIVYTDELYKWMGEIADMFDPEGRDVSSFYIHYKKHSSGIVEHVLPYISEIYIADGSSKEIALTKLVSYQPDGYIDCDLNKKAGGRYVYLAYKRTDSKSEAITDLAIFTGENPSESRRIVLDNNVSIRYDLVANVDLNSKAGGDYLYLYATTNTKAGGALRNLWINGSEVSKTTDSYIESTVLRADDNGFNDSDPDLNDGAGGSYLYLIMKREIPKAEDSNSAGALLGSGSLIAICVLLGVGAIAALAVVYFKRKKKVQ